MSAQRVMEWMTCPLTTSLTVQHILKDVSNRNIPLSVPAYIVLQMVLNYWVKTSWWNSGTNRTNTDYCTNLRNVCFNLCTKLTENCVSIYPRNSALWPVSVQIFSVCNQWDKNTLESMLKWCGHFSFSRGVGVVNEAILKLMWATTTFHMKNPAIN